MPEQIQQIIDRIGGPRRLLVLVVAAAAVAVIFGISHWATAPAWTPVFSGLPIESVGQLADKLDQAGIKYRLDHGGADLLVDAGDVPRARVMLARDGGVPSGGRPGLELFDQPSWSMTDFTQRVNYRRALEGELERTIGKMRGIDGAQVHLALHETATYGAGDTPEEASIVLKVRDTPAPEIVSGIAHLVSSSVDGLRSDNVTIVDDAGHLLSESSEPNSLASLTSHQLAVERDVEQHLARKAEDLLAQMVGRGNARVQVAAAMNFDHVERTTQTVDPDKQAIVTDQKAEIVPGAQGGAGSTNQATSYENSKSTETFAAATGSVRRLTVAVLVNERQAGTGSDKRFERRTPEELERIESLVRTAIGVDSARGDLVSVVSVPFGDGVLPPPVPVVTPSLVSIAREYQQPALGSLGLLLAFVVALFAIRSLRAPKALAALASAPALGQPAATHLLPAAPPRVDASSAVRGRVLAAVEERPDDAARLVRAWLKEG